MARADISVDNSLPIAAARDQIAAAITRHQVVIVAGETGSGKTTQLPKICLQLGRTAIGHTQPRRIAARSVAERIAEELNSQIGELVGYQIRFTKKASRQTQLKVMTDGVLLAEIGRDRDLRRYDTIIIDEAHERSLNIDFLLGYLKQLILRRSDLKIVVTSATIDTERFSAHFATADGVKAPIVEVQGRTYPVEVRYRPILADGEADQSEGIISGVKELRALGGGDILVFLSGEREIRDAAEALEALRLPATEVLPLYARLSSAEQHRVFTRSSGRRIVLSTNVAETSLTVPGIRSVIDTGLVRMSRYSARTKVQRLPIEPISRASANQRAGRCGRVAPGVCIRLYDEEDYRARPEFTEPEILRTNLASVILAMMAADLGDIASFPFVERPDSTQITDGLRLLEELGATQPTRDKTSRHPPRLTPLGRRLATVPVDPRMGRMLLAGAEHGCLTEMLVIVSGLSIQDPRERPADQREAADALHRRFHALTTTDQPKAVRSVRSSRSQEPRSRPVDGSDFLAVLRLWDYLAERQRELSGNAFRRLCRAEFLHFLRIREWQDLHGQLQGIGRDLGLRPNTSPATAGQVHTAVLTGLLSHVGLADLSGDPVGSQQRRNRAGPREYLGARGTKFAINPGSSVAKIQPPLVMAAELVETTRLWARTVAGIEAAQIEQVGVHLLKHTFSEPHWSARAGSVMAYERVSLYGIPIIARRRVSYAQVNPAEAREIFIRSALVEGGWRTRHRFFRDNQATREEAEQLEERTRRRDLVVDDQVIFDFYASRLPYDIVSAAHFDAWWKKAQNVTPDLLTLRIADLMTRELDQTTEDSFPDHWTTGDHKLEITYTFEPGTTHDGVTVSIDVSVLNQLNEAEFTWQVPGLRTELAVGLLRSLPKQIRRHLAPVPEFADRALAWLRVEPPHPGESLAAALARAIRHLTGELVEAQDFDEELVPEHLRITFVVTDGDVVVGEGKHLGELKQSSASRVRQTLNAVAAEFAQSGATEWTFGAIADRVDRTRDGVQVVGYPGLVDQDVTVGLRVHEDRATQLAQHSRGLRRLVLLGTPDPTRWVVSRLSNEAKLSLASSPYASVPELLTDARLASVGELISRAQPGWVADRDRFLALCDQVRVDNPDLMRDIVSLAARTLALHQQVRARLPDARQLSPDAADDITEQTANLIFDRYLSRVGYDHLVDFPRYLQAVLTRIDRLGSAGPRMTEGMDVMAGLEESYARLCAAFPSGPLPPAVSDVGWMLEELRVSLFAQGLRTKFPISPKRVLAAITDARRQLPPGSQ